MTRYECGACGTDFMVEGHAERCLRCGSLDISPAQEEIVDPGASQCEKEAV